MARRVAGIKIDIAANVASLSADMTKAAGILGGFEKQVNSISRNIKMAFGGALFAGAAYGIKQLSDKVLDLAEAGDAAAGIASAFNKLGGDSRALEDAANRTQGLIEKFELMKVANDGLIKGIPNFNKHLADLADLAARVADAKDVDTTETFKGLIDAVSSGKAQGLKEFGFQIGDVKSKAEGTQVALSQLTSVINKFDPVSLGAGDSVTVLKNSLSEMGKNIAIGVDGSAQLATQLQSLRVAADPEQMQKFGMALAGLESVFIGMATKALPVAIQLLENFALALDHIFQITPQGKFTGSLDAQKAKTKSLQDEYSKGRFGLEFRNNDGNFSIIPKPYIRTDARAEELKKQIEESKAAEKKILDDFVNSKKQEAEELAKRQEKIAEDYAKRQKEWMQKFGAGSGKGAGKKEAAATSEMMKVNADALRDSIENAMQRLDVSAFQNLRTQLFETSRSAYIDAHKDLVAAKKMTESELGEMADRNAKDAVNTYDERMKDAIRRHGDELRANHQQAVAQWQGVFDNLFNPQEFNWKDSLKQLASGFLSEITASLFGGLNANLGTFQGVGGAIGAGIIDYFKAQGVGGGGVGWDKSSSFPDLSGASDGQNQNTLSQLFNAGIKEMVNWYNGGSTESAHAQGIQGPGGADGQFNSGSAGWTTNQAHAAGIQGPGGADGNFNSGSSGAQSANYAGYAQAGIALLGDIISAKDRDKASKSNAGTGAAVGGTIGGVLGGIFGGAQGAQIGQQIGAIAGSAIGSMFKWGPQNPETKARHAFANFVEEGFKKLERVSFFDAEGKVRMFNAQNLNFVEGGTGRFNPGGDNGANWGDNFDKLEPQARAFFEGLGNAFEEVLGLTEDVGAQIGYVLAENMQGNINNARLLVQQLGLDAKEMEDALIKAGRSGEMSWAQVESGLQAVNQAFGEGLVEVGNIQGAWEEFIGSGGRGIAALKGIRDLAIETMEAGGQTLEDLQNRLLASGANPEEVAALMQALSQRGIKTLQDLKDANDRTLGGIVADTENSSDKLREQWQKMNDDVEGLKQTLDGIEDNMKKNLTINVQTNFDKNTEEALSKDVFGGTGASKLSGVRVANPTAARAQYRRSVPSTDSAKMSAMTVNVDARGADRGVHADVMTAIATMERRILGKASEMIYSQGRRGAN